MQYDVAVIGGGIHGAGVAQAAAAAGYRVALLEAHGWAEGTSARSSKLIHGGLRYLESGQLNLVYQSLRARQRLLKLAPELVKPQVFFIPLYQHSQRRPWQIRLGLSLYAVLAGLGQQARFRTTPASLWSQWSELRQTGLQAIFQYWDAQTDDRALTLAVLASAQNLGADLFAQTPVKAITRQQQGFTLQSERGCFQATSVVNAAGPWVDTVAALAQPAPPRPSIALVQGSHLVLAEPLPVPGVWYLEAEDSRAVFAMPWRQGCLLGTTEVEVAATDQTPQPSQAEHDYLLATLQRYFPRWRPTVVDQFAGLRVLPAGNDTLFKRSRDTVVIKDRSQQPSWLSIYGGKLTTYQHTAQRVIHQLHPLLGPRTRLADPYRLPLQPVAAEAVGKPGP